MSSSSASLLHSSTDPLIDKLLTDLRTNKAFQAKLSESIVSSLYNKIMYYRRMYITKAKEIIEQDQPRMLKRLCQMGQVKPEIEYEDAEEYYSMTVPRRVRTNLKTKQLTVLSEEDYNTFIESRRQAPYWDSNLFEMNTQCAGTPASGVVFNWQERLSEPATSTEMLASTGSSASKKGYSSSSSSSSSSLASQIREFEKYPIESLDTYTSKQISDIILSSKAESSKDIPQWKELKRLFKDTRGKATKQEIINLIKIIFPTEPEAYFRILAYRMGEWTPELASFELESQASAIESARINQPSAPTAIAPSYEDIKIEIGFYNAALNMRQEIGTIVDLLINQFSELYNYSGPLERLAVDPNAQEIMLKIDPKKFKPSLAARIEDISQAIETFDIHISGVSRKDIRASIVALVRSFANNWRAYSESYINAVLLGPPGSGKTTMAKFAGAIMAKLGILARGNFQEHSRATLVGQYVGETALKVRNILIGALENVLFIDEAYALAQSSGSEKFDSYGVEAINEIVGFLDKNRGKISLIVAGYKCEIEVFWFGVNPGLRRRTRWIWDMPNMTTEEFWDILKSKIETWKANFLLLCKDNTCDRKGGDKKILANYKVGQALYEILDIYKDLLVNQGGDAEAIADVLIGAYYDQIEPLTEETVKHLMYQFLETRTTLYEDKDELHLCANVPDYASTKKMATKICDLLPGRDQGQCKQRASSRR